jgi:hypothetical protein
MNLENFSDSDLAVIGNTWVNDHTKNNDDSVTVWLDKVLANLGYESGQYADFITAMKEVISWDYDGAESDRVNVCECVGGNYAEISGVAFACDWCASYARDVRESLAVSND